MRKNTERLSNLLRTTQNEGQHPAALVLSPELVQPTRPCQGPCWWSQLAPHWAQDRIQEMSPQLHHVSPSPWATQERGKLMQAAGQMI